MCATFECPIHEFVLARRLFVDGHVVYNPHGEPSVVSIGLGLNFDPPRLDLHHPPDAPSFCRITLPSQELKLPCDGSTLGCEVVRNRSRCGRMSGLLCCMMDSITPVLNGVDLGAMVILRQRSAWHNKIAIKRLTVTT